MASSSPNRPVSRRRQRSVRVTVAVALLSLAAVVVVLALPTQSAAWLSVSSVLALLCGVTAARIVYTELLQSRREAALDRAAQARAYRSMFSERAEEHAEFTTAMTDRLARRDRDLRELEGILVLAEKRAIEAETRVQREARRANQAQETVSELQDRISELEISKAEEADELASWDARQLEADVHAELDTVVDLLAWEDKVHAGRSDDDAARQKHA